VRCTAYAAQHAAIVLTAFALLALARPGYAHAQTDEQAQADAQDPGIGPDALPGVRKVPFATAFESGPLAAATLAYGYTDSIEQVRDEHHRLMIEAAGSYALAETIAFGAQLAGRYESHAGGDSAGDSSFLLSTRLHTRARADVGDGFSAGGELAVILPGADSAERGLKSVSPELRALGSYGGLHPKLLLGAVLGVRIDRSGEGIAEPQELPVGDRVALGASDSSALLLGVGGTYSASSQLRVIGELGWDLLVGPRAPGAFESPIRITGGLRYGLTSQLALDGFLSLSPSARPNASPADPLVPIEPRVVLGVGLSARFTKPPVREALLIGHIVNELGEPIAGATVTVTDAARKQTRTATTDRTGAFSMTSYLGARLALRARADHRVAGQLEVVLGSLTFDLGDWSLPRGRGALVGRVLGPDGTPKPHVAIGAYTLSEGSAGNAPPLAEMITTEDGTFALRDLPAGPLRLSARALGLRDAQLDVVVPVEGELSAELSLAEALPEGQIRGTVRGFGGAPLSATIRVEPLGLVLSAARDGTFSIDVAPGQYEVLVTAPGYEPQQRVADVERDGVTVLPVDLVRQP
jgi:hypothetical protein